MKKSFNQQFKIPLPKTLAHDVFAIDEYLQLLGDPVSRRQIITEHGNTQSQIAEFEQKRRLPPGSFEFAVMMEDQRFQQFSRQLTNKYLILFKDLKFFQIRDSQQEIISSLRHETESLFIGIEKLYPNAVRFVVNYRAVYARATGSSVFRPDDPNDLNLRFCAGIIPFEALALALIVFFIFFATVVYIGDSHTIVTECHILPGA